jgi:hypothetical protein
MYPDRYYVYFDGAEVAARVWQRLLGARNCASSALLFKSAKSARIVAEYSGGRLETVYDSTWERIAAPLGPRSRRSPLAERSVGMVAT